jgi:protein-disulfide isomerase
VVSKRSSVPVLAAAAAGLALLLGGCTSSVSGGAESGAAASATQGDGLQIPAKQLPGAAYPVTFEAAGGTVLSGQPSAPTTVDAYADCLCPYCGEFEKQNADAIESQLEAGRIKVRYHILNLLDSHSQPQGYSTLAADAALLVAQSTPKAFPAFHASLFATQPEEGDAGYTAAQLVGLAQRLGVTDPAFAGKVSAQPYAKQIGANLTAAENNPALQQSSGGQTGFGTPTVLVNGKLANWSGDTGWLTDTK